MIDINKEPWRLCEIENPTEEECLISVKANPNHIFMVRHLTPKIKECVNPLWVALWHDLRILNFDYELYPKK